MMDEVLKQITPTEAETREMKEVCQALIGLVGSEMSRLGFDVQVAVYGSVSRDTWLTHEKDIDLFVKFPAKYSKKELEDAVTLVGEKILTGLEKRFAEHPYVRGIFSGHPVEIVPCYRVEDAKDRISAVDRTPFHDRFVRDNLGGRHGDVRLLKQFLRGIGCYGAEARVEGFSGYLSELLVIRYGSFEAVLKAASEWKRPASIDLIGDGDGVRFPGDPLIVIDPTDPLRNVASALSLQNFSLFTFAAKQFLKSPKESFFFPKKRVHSKDVLAGLLRRRGTEIIQVSFQTPSVIDDILYSQLKKAVKLFERMLVKSCFTILNSGSSAGENTVLAFELEHRVLPNARLHFGPHVNSKNELDFVEKHRESKKALGRPFIRGERWAVFVKRETPDAADFFKQFISSKKLKKKGVPSYIAASIEAGFEIAIGESVFENNREFYTQFLDPKFPWENSDV
ncbi:MAG TPA: CCA tRNA nucleotidyltransferase [Euryarchaeota archaeon]|nr:CCA tRNA nucleotidyltransferase [Euryarchaeota archaeon]